MFQNFGTLYSAYDEKDKELFFTIINLLKKVNIEKYLSFEYIKGLNLWIYRYYIVYEILTNIDIDDKEIIFNYILNLIDRHQEQEILTAYDILLANLYGHIMSNLNDDSVKIVEKAYLSLIHNLSKPYLFCRKKTLWNKYISKTIYYTIILYIVNFQNKDKCIKYINDFVSIKKGLPHYLDNEINDLIQNMEKQMENDKQ